MVLAARRWFYSGPSSDFVSRFTTSNLAVDGKMTIAFFDLRRRPKTYPMDADKIKTLDKPIESTGGISFSFYSKHLEPVKTPIILYAIIHYYGQTAFDERTQEIAISLH